MSARRDLAALVGGIALIALGVVLLLDQAGAIELRFATFAPIAFAAVGASLLASGMTRRDG